MSRKNMLAWIVAGCVPMWWTGVVWAQGGPDGTAQPPTKMVDVIRLSNGNKITGRVVRMSDGEAEIEIEGVGEITMPASDIVSVTKQPYVSPRTPSPEEKRAQEQRFAQEHKEAQVQYERYLDRRFRQQTFDEDCRRQHQLEADWREFLNHPNINSRFQEDMFFMRFGPWGRFAPWTRY